MKKKSITYIDRNPFNLLNYEKELKYLKPTYIQTQKAPVNKEI